jgi:hypothetical protein
MIVAFADFENKSHQHDTDLQIPVCVVGFFVRNLVARSIMVRVGREEHSKSRDGAGS